MAEAASIKTGDVRNLANGHIKGDQIGGDKVGRDKFIIEIHNAASYSPTASQHPDRNPEGSFNEGRQIILQLLSSMLQAELRDRRLVGLNEVICALKKLHTLYYTGTLDTSQSGSEMRFSDLLPLIATSTLGDPKVTLRAYASMRNIRQRKENIRSYNLLGLQRLQVWVVKPCSSLAFVKSSFDVVTRHALRDFSTDFIHLLLKTTIPVIWVLSPRGSNIDEYTSIDILKSLVSQILQQSPSMLDERCASLAAERCRDACTEDDWFNILGSALACFKMIYIVFDLDFRPAPGQMQKSNWSSGFSKLFDQLQARQISTMVKVIFLTCRKSNVMRPKPECFSIFNIGSTMAAGRELSAPLQKPRQMRKLSQNLQSTYGSAGQQ